MAAALVLLGIFVGWNFLLNERSQDKDAGKVGIPEKEQVPDVKGLTARRLAFHDFETGDAGDTVLHLARTGHGGKQSLKMGAQVPFSPGLWIKFRDLDPGDSSWIRATGFVWFDGLPTAVNCWLVVTCNRDGVNFKYMHFDLGKENLLPGRWNRVSIDYRIPPVHSPGDVLQAYFWYRGGAVILIDDIEIELITYSKKKKTT